MDFAFVNELSNLLAGSNIFKFTFTGFKILAFAILLFRILETFVKDFEGQEPRMGNLISILGYGLVIMSSDWVITSIENIFASVDVAMHGTSSNLYADLDNLVDEKYKRMFEGAEDGFDYVGIVLSSIPVMVSLFITFIIGGLCKLADLSMTASFLIQRIFILHLLKMLFPLTIALSTYSGTQKLFHTWILRYIGIFILGIAYIGIINISSMIQSTLMFQFGSDFGDFSDGSSFAVGIIVTMVVVFVVKVALFKMVTSYVMGMFQ